MEILKVVTVSNVFDEDVRNRDLSTKWRRATEMAAAGRRLGILLYTRWDRLGFSELGIEYILYKYIHYECRKGRKNNTLQRR